MNTPSKCSETVWDGTMFHRYPCQKAAKVERDGKHYCATHDPERIAKRQKEREDKQNEKDRVEQELRRLFPSKLPTPVWVRTVPWGFTIVFQCKDAEAVRALAARFKESSK